MHQSYETICHILFAILRYSIAPVIVCTVVSKCWRPNAFICFCKGLCYQVSMLALVTVPRMITVPRIIMELSLYITGINKRRPSIDIINESIILNCLSSNVPRSRIKMIHLNLIHSFKILTDSNRSPSPLNQPLYIYIYATRTTWALHSSHNIL